MVGVGVGSLVVIIGGGRVAVGLGVMVCDVMGIGVDGGAVAGGLLQAMAKIDSRSHAATIN